jgi:MFS family permease
MLGVRLIFPALLPEIKAEFLLTNTTAGILLGALWISFATAQLPGGVLTDRIGERNTLVASAVMATIGIGVIVLSPGLVVFALGVLLFGFGSGLFGTPRLTVLSDIYPDRGATAIGINAAVGNFGNVILPVVATVVSGWFAWRIGIGVVLPGFVLLVGGFWLVIPVRTSSEMQDGGDGSRRRIVRRIIDVSTGRPIVVATAAMVLVGFVWQGYTSFLPTYLVEVKGLPQSTGAIALGAFFVTGGVVQPLVGNVADRYDERRILIAVTAIPAVAIAAFPFANSASVLIALSTVAGLQLAFWPIIFAYIPRVLPDDIQGSGFGLLRTVFLYVGATGPIVIGALADFDLFDESFILLAAITGIGTLLSAVLPRVAR